MENSTGITTPYKDIEQHTRIQLQPHHLNSDLDDNIKTILQKKVEKKCNKYGYIDKVYNVIKYSNGVLLPENLSGNITLEISYNCRFCLPVENSTIICQVKGIHQELIIAKNGPITVFIRRNNINQNNWNITSGYVNTKNNKELENDDFIKVNILKKRINQNDLQIKTIGSLEDYPTDEEREKYYGQTTDDENLKQDKYII